MIYSPDFYYQKAQEFLPCVKGRLIVIWGTTDRGCLIKDALEYCGLDCAFFVSSRAKTKYYSGLPIYGPDVLNVIDHYVINAAYSSGTLIEQQL